MMGDRRRRGPASAATASSEAQAPRVRFRRHLRSGTVDLIQIREHLARAVPQLTTDPEVRVAVEELVSHAGSLLGFSTAEDSGDGGDLWTSATGVSLLVGVAHAAEIPGAMVTLSHARERLLASIGTPARKISALSVVCGAQVDWRRVEEAVAVRRMLHDVRLVSVDALLTMVALRAERVLAHTDAVALLRPADARADAMIEVVARYRRVGKPAPDQ
jgi:hypothetical protein